MKKKVVTAIGNDSIYNLIKSDKYELIEDIPYQEGIIELLKRDFLDVIIISEELSGEFDKYIFIDKIREIDAKAKVIVIVFNEDENYKKFLYSKGIFNIFVDGKDSIEELIGVINEEIVVNAGKGNLSHKNSIDVKRYIKENKNGFNSQIVPKFQKQQVITLVGNNSSGKTTVTVELSLILARLTKAKILIMDLDTVNAEISQFLGIKKEPNKPDYILPTDKNSSLNYMIEAIDKRNFDANVFEKYIVKSGRYSNLDVLTGNQSLYISKNILNIEYYSRILECAKSLYDYIIIDTSSNVFLDSMQFSMINSSLIFFITEGNYISLKKSYKMLNDIFPNWGINNKKIHILINKYSKKSLDKTIIKEMLKEYSITGYISFSDKYEEMINSINPVLPKELEKEFLIILEKFELISTVNYKKTIFSLIAPMKEFLNKFKHLTGGAK